MRGISTFIWLTLTTGMCAAQTYFPTSVLGHTPEASNAAAMRYTAFLRALHEPSLFELAQRDPKAEAYRFLWLRESDRPAAIRFMKKPGGTGWFYRRMTTGTGGSVPGHIGEYGMSWSWKSRTASFLSTVEDSGFWKLPTLAEGDGGSGCRAHWIIEGVKNGQYHVVDRCSPDLSDPVRLIGTRAMKLGNLRVRGSHVY